MSSAKDNYVLLPKTKSKDTKPVIYETAKQMPA